MGSLRSSHRPKGPYRTYMVRLSRGLQPHVGRDRARPPVLTLTRPPAPRRRYDELPPTASVPGRSTRAVKVSASPWRVSAHTGYARSTVLSMSM